LKQISLNISDIQEESIQKIIDLGFFPNRSLAIRYFVQEGINETIKMVEKLRAGVLDYDQYYSEKFYKLVNARITKKVMLPKLLNLKGVEIEQRSGMIEKQ
jgi:Arc/MetJ-type ribon-helix-helix transcriptional regulator